MMNKIQVSSGHSSSATHRLTQASTTLNRRYVRRPANIAIEQAAREASFSHPETTSPARPSRLVNLGVRSADLEAAREQRIAAEQVAAQAELQTSTTMIPKIVEFGGENNSMSTSTSNTDTSSLSSENYAPEASAYTPEAPVFTSPTPEAPVFSTPTPEPAPQVQTSQPAEYSFTSPQEVYYGQVAVDQSAIDSISASTNTMPQTMPAESFSNSIPQPETTSFTQTSTTPSPEINTNELAMNIAADYAAASLGASMKEYGDNYNSYAMSQPTISANSDTPESVEAIARAASEAIASIRTATEPSEVSEQITSLKAFADSIKSNHDTPEMRELGDTIDKFVSIAMKSSKVQAETAKKSSTKSTLKPATKITLSSKANRAAAKVTKSSAKVMAANRIKTAGTKTSVAKKTAAPAARSTSKPLARRSASTKSARKVSSAELKERAIEQALESVATMSEKPSSKTARRQPAMRAKRKGGVKRFVIAFTCAAICVGGVITFVSSNIPDISVRVAAMQTGITAAYPSYVPRDYKLGDIFSENGKISMIFDGPSGSSFTLEEEKSSWDSSALLRNFVEPNWGEDYTTTHEQGITIYLAESNSDAVWVNGGVLYKITSSGTPLTKKQVRSIVTSL